MGMHGLFLLYLLISINPTPTTLSALLSEPRMAETWAQEAIGVNNLIYLSTLLYRRICISALPFCISFITSGSGCGSLSLFAIWTTLGTMMYRVLEL